MERSNGIMRLLVAATVAAILLLAMAIVAVIVTVRFRRNRAAMHVTCVGDDTRYAERPG